MPVVKESEQIFYRMLCPESEEFSRFYLNEEIAVLQSFVSNYAAIKKMNFVVVGAGPLLHVSLGCENAKCYIAVDPMSHLFINDLPQDFFIKNPKIKIVSKYFENLQRCDIPSRPSLYVFTFNVISYINDFVAAVNNIVKKGDVLFVSYWNNDKKNEDIINDYFDFVYGEGHALRRQTMIDTHNIDCKKISLFKEVQKTCGNVVKTIVVYT
jgi:hypothetical protein